MTDKKYDSIVIGGGIVGLFCAYYLGKKGHSVLILDKGPLEQASSHGNCGLVSPSHIMPLNSYELIVKSIGWLFKKDAPFHIKPQLDPRFIKWSLQFVQNASGKNVYKNAQAIHDIIISSRSLFAEVIEQEKIDCHWSADGIHFVFKYKKGFDQYKDTNDYTSQFGVSAQPIAGREIHEIEPALQDDVYGSWFYDIDAWLKPSELVAEMRKILAKNNVDILQGQEVTNFENSTSSIETITTKSGDTFAGQNYILATGAWSPLLGDQHGLKLPIIPGKGYSITMKSPSIVPQAPCIMMERKVVATPWKETYRLGSTMELAGYDETLNKTRIQALKKAAKEYLKEPYTDEVEEEWYGWRPMTYDGVPIICRSPKQKNLYVAAGHNMLGLSMATGTGKLVSELILGEEPHIDPGLYQYKT